jgi:hypothetical protein
LDCFCFPSSKPFPWTSKLPSPCSSMYHSSLYFYSCNMIIASQSFVLHIKLVFLDINLYTSIAMLDLCILSNEFTNIWVLFCVAYAMFMCVKEYDHLTLVLSTFQNLSPSWISLFINFVGVCGYDARVWIGQFTSSIVSSIKRGLEKQFNWYNLHEWPWVIGGVWGLCP